MSVFCRYFRLPNPAKPVQRLWGLANQSCGTLCETVPKCIEFSDAPSEVWVPEGNLPPPDRITATRASLLYRTRRVCRHVGVFCHVAAPYVFRSRPLTPPRAEA